jgi:hypothetical protein
VIDGSHHIYFARASDLLPEMRTVADDLDIALLRVWGWGPRLGWGTWMHSVVPKRWGTRARAWPCQSIGELSASLESDGCNRSFCRVHLRRVLAGRPR